MIRVGTRIQGSKKGTGSRIRNTAVPMWYRTSPAVSAHNLTQLKVHFHVFFFFIFFFKLDGVMRFLTLLTRAVSAHNLTQLKRLVKAAREEMARQEIRNK
jgi:hypothetical protein